jgi:hypothetical protein
MGLLVEPHDVVTTCDRRIPAPISRVCGYLRRILEARRENSLR